MKFLYTLLPLFLFPSIVIAEEGGFFSSISGIIPAATGAAGFGIGIITILPLIFRLAKSVKDAKKTTLSIYDRYEKNNQVRADIKRLIDVWDRVLECVADITARLQMKKTTKFLRELL